MSSEWSWEDYTLICFRYILHNPVRAGLVTHPADWEFSSYRDVAGIRKGSLCNQELIYLELGLEWNQLDEIAGLPVGDADVEKLW